MRITDYISLGFKNLWTSKARSFLTILAIVIGAISMIIMLSLVLGAKQVARQQLESIDGLTLISVSADPEMEASGNLLSTDIGSQESGKQLNDTHLALLRQLPHIIDATPIVGVWAKSCRLEGSEKRYRASLTGYDPRTQALKISTGFGRPLEPGDMDRIVIGTGLVRSLGYADNPKDLIGKKLILYTEGGFNDWEADPPVPPMEGGDKYWEEMQKMPHAINATIVGIVTGGPDEYTNYITLDWARRLSTQKEWRFNDTKMQEFKEAQDKINNELQRDFESRKQQLFRDKESMTDNEVKAIEEQFNEEMRAEAEKRMAALGYADVGFMYLNRIDYLAKNGYASILVRVDSTENIEKAGKDVQSMGLGALTAKNMLDQIEKIFMIVGMIVGAIGGIVLFVAALGIINTMIMATYERTREIGIMRACGATRSDIRNLFVYEAGIMGLIGGAVGLGVSVGLAKAANAIVNNIAAEQGVPITNLIQFQPWLIASIIGLTTMIGIISGLLPAIRASGLDPVEALRSE